MSEPGAKADADLAGAVERRAVEAAIEFGVASIVEPATQSSF
jgi:hypothetical protein